MPVWRIPAKVFDCSRLSLYRCFRCLMVLFLVLQGITALACEQKPGYAEPVLVFPPKFKAKDREQEYTFNLIRLILAKSIDKYGPCNVVYMDTNIPLNRAELYLEKNQRVHVVSLTVTRDRDKRFLPVRLPLSRGLRGLRLLLIRESEQPLYSAVRSLDGLRALTAGQGANWVDTQILRQNGLSVITTDNVNSLAGMLASRRFDYFPRGSRELVSEMPIYQNLPIVLESDLVLSYPNLTALYVHRENYALAHRLEYGLERAYDDGSFDQFFYAHHSVEAALKYMDLENRRVLHLCNPYLPPWVPIQKANYWLVPWPEHMQTTVCMGQQRVSARGN